MIIPESDTPIVIIGIDPGSTNLGVSIYTMDSIDVLTSIESFTLRADRLPSSEWMGELHGDRTRRLNGLSIALSSIFNTYNPSMIVSESGYINVRRPAAYGALIEVVSMIRNAIIEYDPQCSLNFIEPSNVKKAVGAGWISDKHAVKEAVSKIEEIIQSLSTPLDTLDEHSVDATAVAYAYIKKLRG